MAIYESVKKRGMGNTSLLLYLSSVITTVAGTVYASVPLYRIFCQQTGFGGTPKILNFGHGNIALQAESLAPVPGAAPVKIRFVAETSNRLPWRFIPQQQSISVIPGQTALAFYSAESLGEEEVVGMATYNIIPARAAQYFNKIQCFCFEEQRLGPGEKVDMPVFFYLDPEYAYDPTMDNVKEIILSYVFFNTDRK